MKSIKPNFHVILILMAMPFFANADSTENKEDNESIVIEGQRYELGGRGRIIDDVVVVKDGDAYLIDITFSQFFRYVWHTPKRHGNSLTIMIEPALTSRVDRDALSDRAVITPNIDNFPVTEIMYEGIFQTGFIKDSNNDLRSRRIQNGGERDGPFLVIQFDRKYEIEVIQDSGFRSLTVKIN